MQKSARKPAAVQPGERFGFVLILAVIRAGRHGRQTKFRYRCDCGVERVVDGWAFLNRNQRSCGHDRIGANFRHGYTVRGLKPEWQAWNHMLQRCYNPKDSYYKDYGGRGIIVCEQWRNSFEAFLSDMGTGQQASTRSTASRTRTAITNLAIAGGRRGRSRGETKETTA